MIRCFLLSVLVFCAVSCSSGQHGKIYSICIENGVSRFEIESEFAECFGIAVEDIDSYEIYKIAESVNISIQDDVTVSILKNKLSAVIAGNILMRLKNAFGQNVEEYWKLERITIPVKYRSFRKNDGENKDVTVIGMILKSELTPRALIKYLPLEYKMQFIEKKNDKYYFKEDPMSDF
ncbi:MAG: hypothetical protein JW982_02090 [Spirochaetes bacterium]|nr:hypothetical protein [Spirochaetota bacterium]